MSKYNQIVRCDSKTGKINLAKNNEETLILSSILKNQNQTIKVKMEKET